MTNPRSPFLFPQVSNQRPPLLMRKTFNQEGQKRCPHPPDRLVYFQHQIVQPFVESGTGCFILFGLTVLMMVKMVFLLFSLTEIMLCVGMVFVLLILSCFPNIAQQFSAITRMYTDAVSFWRQELKESRMTKLHEQMTSSG